MNMKILPLITAVVAFIFGANAESSDSEQETVEIDTPSGRMKGIKTQAYGKVGAKSTIFEFRKVPFAKSPENELRFKNPEPYGKWNDVLDATQFGPSCLQYELPFMSNLELPNKEYSEDCLFLNIYIPHTLSDERKRPVMIWIHGGGYTFGQGSLYPASTLATFGDVIVVTINYRVGIFGFFSLDNDAAAGNYGLLDQQMAFQWVHDNIDAFGGDPQSVTIFGESAGGFSASLHALISSNKGLFQRVIAQSGASHLDFALSKTAHIFSKKVGNTAGCQMSESDDTGDFLNCLRNKTGQEILMAYLMSLPDPSDPAFAFVTAPVVDGKLIPEPTPNLLSESHKDICDFFHSLDFMAGITSHEGSILFMTLASPMLQTKHKFDLKDGIPSDVFCNVVAKALVADIFEDNTEVWKSVCERYTDTSSVQAQGMRAVDMLGDAMFLSSAVQAVNLHSKDNSHSKTYMYQYSRTNKFPLLPAMPWFKGSGHGDDIGYLFGFEFEKFLSYKLAYGDEDLTLSKIIMRYLTNFAKTGNPNLPLLENGVKEWPEYDTEKQEYIDMDLEFEIKSQSSSDIVDFWLNHVQNLLKKGKPHEEL